MYMGQDQDNSSDTITMAKQIFDQSNPREYCTIRAKLEASIKLKQWEGADN